MSKKRLITTVGGTAMCALGIGYFMQMGNADPMPAAVPRPAPIQQAIIAPYAAPAPAEDASLDLTGITLMSAQPESRSPMPMPVPELERSSDKPASSDGAALSTPPAPTATAQQDCEVTALAVPGPEASVDLNVTAPCFGNERATVHHSGMIFAETTDYAGTLSLTVPALSERAVFIIAFANGKGAVATASVPDLANYDRVVLQWSGRSGFELHALEFGADYNEPGHVWRGADAATRGAIGSVVRLGDAGTLAPQMAEVYSIPATAQTRSGTVAFSVEAEVTDANCGRDIAAQSLELKASTGTRTRDLLLSVPNCSAVGDFLVLNNLVDDLKIAAK